jgi:hypothetical protein
MSFKGISTHDEFCGHWPVPVVQNVPIPKRGASDCIQNQNPSVNMFQFLRFRVSFLEFWGFSFQGFRVPFLGF